jgi:multicomponent Na+:H+ antiporter subunit B
MRKVIALILLTVIAFAVGSSVSEIPFGRAGKEVGDYYINKGIGQTGAVNIVTAVVLNYRGLDTLGEVTVLFVAALGLGAVFATVKRKTREQVTPPSLILTMGCKCLFPFIFLLGIYIFLHGHLSPGGGFQGGAVIASGFLLIYLGCPGRRVNEYHSSAVESLGGLVFIFIGLLGLAIGGHFLLNFLPKGIPNTLFSGGIIPVIYIAIGFKVGSELAAIIDDLVEKS